MRIFLRKILFKLAILGFIISAFGMLYSATSLSVKAVQDPVFELVNGAYIHEVREDFADKKAMRFVAYVTDTWVEDNLSSIDYTFYTKVTANGKTAYKTWEPTFDEDGIFYRYINIANLPSESFVENVYSEEFVVTVGVTTTEDFNDGVPNAPIKELDSVTRSMEYVATMASMNGAENVSTYYGGGSILVNNNENVVEISGTNKTPNGNVSFNEFDGASVKTVYLNSVKQSNASAYQTSSGNLDFSGVTSLTKGQTYSALVVTTSGDVLVANYVMPVDFAISDVASYLEWYSAGTSLDLEYYVALTNNVYLTENERIDNREWKYLANGVMDGRGYVLDGLRLSYTGLWKDIGDFTFKNIALTNIHNNAAYSDWDSLFSYNAAVSLNFDNVFLSYKNESKSASKYVGFTGESTLSNDEDVHFYNSVIVADQPNTTATLFKLGVVGTLSNTKVVSLQNRYVTTGVLADYTSLDDYYTDTDMSTSGYNLDVWTVIDGVLVFKKLINGVTVSGSTIGKNLLEDTVEIAVSDEYIVKSVKAGETELEYTHDSGIITVKGLLSLATGTHDIMVVISDGVDDYTFTKPVSMVNNKTATDADYNGYIILDGVSKHTLVIPSSTDTYSSKAITDFKSLFKEATGLSLSTTTDSTSISYSDSSRYIVLGGANIYKKAGLTVDESVKDDGYQIVTQGQSIFILGKTTRGGLFGAYELLTKLFNYERFSPDTYTLNTGVEYLALPDFDLIDNPDSDLRIGGWGSVYYNADEANALTMRFDMNYKDLWITDSLYGANWTHNIAEIMDYVGHIPEDLTTITDNYGNKVRFDVTASDWYVDNTFTYHYYVNDNGVRTRVWGTDANGVDRISYGFKVGWFSVSASSSTMSSYGDPLRCTTNNDAIINRACQLCYSGGTYPTDTEHPVWKKMVEFGAKRVANIINAYEGSNKIFQITAEDNNQYCQCRACRAWYEYYSQGNLYLYEYINTSNVVMSKGLMGLQLRFVNALAKYITDNNLLNEDKKDVKIATFCYSNYTDAPCIENADGSFSPIDQAVVCPDNVLIYYAPSMDYTKTLSDATMQTSETNYKMLRILKANSVICDHIGAWLYQMSDYDDYFLPSNNYYAYGDIYRTLLDMGAKWIFHQGAQKSTTRNTAFAQLKLYLNSKLSWDSSLNEQDLIDKFFEGYYGPAAETMKEFFYSVYAVVDANGGHTTLSRTVFSQEDLEYWISLCEQALSDIASLKTTNSKRYNQLVLNINCEMMMPRYLLIRLYRVYKGSTFTAAKLSTIKTQFTAECKAAGVLTGNNQTGIDSVSLTYVS